MKLVIHAPSSSSNNNNNINKDDNRDYFVKSRFLRE